MKARAVGLVALTLLVGVPVGARDYHYHRRSHNHSFNFCTFHSWDTDSAHWRLKDGGIIISNRDDHSQTVRVTEDGQLFVNDQQVRLDNGQQQEVKQFRDLTYEVVDDVKGVAGEGISLGLKGVNLGIKAVGGVLKMLTTDYTENDLERDMDAEAAKLDDRANALQKRADKIDDKINRLQDLGDHIKASVPELKELDWLSS